MVSEIRIYMEGSGDQQVSKAKLREAMRTFLHEIWQIKPIKSAIIPCGSRDDTFEDFLIALESHPDAFNILLVDAEGPVKDSPWQHLRRRDKWPVPSGLNDDQCHLMVTMMEAWLIVDRAALETFYGQGFKTNSLPKRLNVEEIDKAELITALEKATERTKAGIYHKTRHGPQILKLANPTLVRAAAPHCERLFVTLITKLTEDS